MTTTDLSDTDKLTRQRGALSRKDAATYLSISTRLLDQLATKGKLPRAKIGFKSVFLIADLDEFLKSCRQTNGGQK